MPGYSGDTPGTEMRRLEPAKYGASQEIPIRDGDKLF